MRSSAATPSVSSSIEAVFADDDAFHTWYEAALPRVFRYVPSLRPRSCLGRGADPGTATLLDDGRVLVAGGGLSGSVVAEIYDPASGTHAPRAYRGRTATGASSSWAAGPRLLILRLARCMTPANPNHASGAATAPSLSEVRALTFTHPAVQVPITRISAGAGSLCHQWAKRPW
jgi:hypothetical protein